MEDATYLAITEDETTDLEVACYGFGVADDDIINHGLRVEYLPSNT